MNQKWITKKVKLMADQKLIVNGKRIDGRGPEDLRNIRIETGILQEADGSSFVDWGGN